MADENPQATVTGVDLSPIQPTFTPPNCKFEIDDVTAPWTYRRNSFDFINIRSLYGSIADWPALYSQVYDHLMPGGWLHQLEMSIQFRSDDGWMQAAGFNSVQESWYKVPVRGWSSDPHMKELGKWNLLHCTQGAEGWGLFLLTKVLQWKVEEAQVFIAKFRNGLKDKSVHAYFEV
jgi:hypothetical protein